MAGRQKIDLRMSCKDPEPVMLSPESLYSCALGQVPHPDALVLRVGDYHVLCAPLRCSVVQVTLPVSAAGQLSHMP